MNRKLFWSVISVVTVFSLGMVYFYFEQAIPMIHVAISMDKNQAQQQAEGFAQEKQWNIEGYDNVVLFQKDEALQTFVELEGGGKSAYREMVKQEYHQPYLWRVRFFKEQEIAESLVWFTPQGKKYGFMQKLPEDQQGVALEKKQAQVLAEQELRNFEIDLNLYKLVEHEKNIRPSKRVDHTFVYERIDRTLNKGLYRVYVTVAGDKVTGLQHKIKVPDEFTRRYAQMYSANKLIATIAQFFLMLLFLLFFGLFAFLFLYPRRYLLINPTKKVMVAIAACFGLFVVNRLPLLFNNYSTVNSKLFFVVQYLAQVCLGLLLFALILGLIVLITEAVGRYVFKDHVQFFKLLHAQAIGSYTVAEQVVLGYCCAAIGLGYVVSFMLLFQYWGWWVPLEALIDPNILSIYVPFISPILTALYAGFSEELVFRALPIAGMLLLTRSSKHQKLWLGCILVVQALVFGAAHANYITQPSYARVIELFPESLWWGWLYYAFGLLPGILAHFLYDAALMMIPVFVSGLWIQKILGVFAMAVPLLAVGIQWARQSMRLTSLPESFFNHAYKEQGMMQKIKSYKQREGELIPAKYQQYAYLLGIIGVMLFCYSPDFIFDTPEYVVSQSGAVTYFASKQRPNWSGLRTVVTVDTSNKLENRFVFQELGHYRYKQLLDSYVMSPYQAVRDFTFEGSVEQRAEEFGEWVGTQGNVLNVWHKLPEAVHGADVSENKAKEIALDFVASMYDLQEEDVQFIAVDSTKHEHRRDWSIILQDIKKHQCSLRSALNKLADKKGQARIAIQIGGDKVVGAYRFVHVPEEWKRQEQDRIARNGLLQAGCYWVMLLLVAFFGYIGLVRVGLSTQFFMRVSKIGFVLLISNLLGMFNKLKLVYFGLNTAESLRSQLISWMSSSMVAIIAGSIVGAILLVLVWLLSAKKSQQAVEQQLFLGIALGCVLKGLLSSIRWFELLFLKVPRSPMYDLLNNSSFLLGLFSNYLIPGFIWSVIVLGAIFVVGEYVFEKYNNRFVQFLLYVLAFVAFNGSFGITTVQFWLLSSVVSACGWYVAHRFFYRQNIELLFVTVMTILSLSLLPSLGVFQQGLKQPFGLFVLVVFVFVCLISFVLITKKTLKNA